MRATGVVSLLAVRWRIVAGFVCIYYGNTGSSWLIDALGASPQVLVAGFEPVEAWAWDVPAEERLAWMRTALNPPAARNGPEFEAWVDALRVSPQVTEIEEKPEFEHVGFKMNDLAVFAADGVASVLEEAEAKAILLTRTNRIKHALSLYRYHEEDKSQFGGKGVRPPSKVDLGLFANWVRESQRLHDAALQVREVLLERLGPDHVADIAYEDFVSVEGKMRTLDSLSEFLGVEPIEPTEKRFAKATPDDLRSAVVNYRSLRLRYAFTPLRVFFDE